MILVRHLFLALLLSLIASITAVALNWAQFRGPRARGIGESQDLPDTWSATENVAWKADIPGRGWSSPIVWGNKVFLTTVINAVETEVPKKGLYMGGNRLDIPTTVHSWNAYCLDLATGEIIWERTLHQSNPDSPIHLKNSYASETPTTDGERVYFYFGHLGIFAYDLDGDLVWSKDIEARKTRHGWGTAASPILHQGRLFLVNDNDEASWVMALDAKSGKEIWKVDREPESNWSTPYIWENEQRTELIVPATYRVISYDLDGEELWSFKGMSSITIGTPYSADGLLYVVLDTWAVDTSPSMPFAPELPAIFPSTKPQGPTIISFGAIGEQLYNPTTLVYKGLLYSLLDRGMISIMNSQTGAFHVERQKIPENTSGFTASPWAYDDKVFMLNEDGETFVIEAGDSYNLIGVNRLADDDMGMATPAIAGNKLLIRTSARLYCIESN